MSDFQQQKKNPRCRPFYSLVLPLHERHGIFSSLQLLSRFVHETGGEQRQSVYNRPSTSARHHSVQRQQHRVSHPQTATF